VGVGTTLEEAEKILHRHRVEKLLWSIARIIFADS